MINIEEVGNRIAECRKKLNITQTELAEKLLVSSKTISKWEKGHGLPNIEILPEIAEIFGITIDYLLLGKKSLDNKISIVKNSGEFGITKLIFPDINDFPKELQHPILTHFLGEYAKLNNIDFVEMLESKGFDGVVYNPDYTNLENKNSYEDQLKWELKGISEATAVLFWIERDMPERPGLTTNVEFGYWLHSGRVVYGRPDSSEKCLYLDMLYKLKTGKTPCKTLESLVNNVLDFLNE
jgi:transcriptional regulator with XRE-family HTH domain